MITPDPRPYPLDHLARRGEGEGAALIVGEQRLTYSDLDDLVGKTAAGLLARDLRQGDRVATWMGKTVLACVMPLAAARAGLVHVPINPVLKRSQAAHILADSGARLLVANRLRLDTLADPDLSDATAVALEDWRGGDDKLQPSAHDPNDLTALLYTSGSTGRPKGVMLSHANLWLGAVSVAHYLGLKPDDRTLAVLPLAFDYGQNQLLSAWYAGGNAIGFDYLLPRDVVRAAGRHDVTVLAGVPPLWLQLAGQQWGDAGRSLRTLTNSGGHLPELMVRRLRELFPKARLHLMYGLTEAFRSSSLDPALVDEHPDSVGTAIPFANLRVVRPDGTAAAAGEEGELVHSGPLVAQGYWNDPNRTAQRFRNGEVWSGDTVVQGEDGLLRFRGRDDAMIKVSGNRISPTEIEEAALTSGAVSDAAAFGVPDERLGQAIVLVVVTAGEGKDEMLSAHLRRELPPHMQPREIIWKDALPTGPNGKLDRTALKAELA
ncbi:AMP-binding protein [Sphingomonas edaphi]|uniref:AMP-binding protein n=1 Tax=Sphingomonas edaphi TaxID=2315689 RepID=A0A418Q1K1_9SPHN|nr:AMP-binding protein [Sphingomonas edaphi]RIX31737.1 AMP-binding protein [Sphingomonas edaphi]